MFHTYRTMISIIRYVSTFTIIWVYLKKALYQSSCCHFCSKIWSWALSNALLCTNRDCCSYVQIQASLHSAHACRVAGVLSPLPSVAWKKSVASWKVNPSLVSSGLDLDVIRAKSTIIWNIMLLSDKIWPVISINTFSALYKNQIFIQNAWKKMFILFKINYF